ncbi:PilZ domain-containing protein [Maridesulfovibrio sp.]|uniref:PilZ domain-containing protein n=1 Tax=Maridesulfovibrio sp. TaxID=2795000 RepID=UPI002A18D872|nr:PilZ domain-containing protein [Maridesulfovibrio sp.]
MRIILVSGPGSGREAYIKALREFGVAFDVSESLLDLSEMHNQVRCNGFIIDVPTLLRSGAADKAEANLLMDNFPVLRINYNASSGIRGIPSGRFSGTSGDLKTFILESCNSFPARSLRGTKRANKVLNVILNRDLNSPGSQIEKSVTLNFSTEGGFFFSVSNWKKGDYAWIVVKELDDKTPIKSLVQWVVPWGRLNHFPGIGVQFLNISNQQADQIDEFIRGKKELK